MDAGKTLMDKAQATLGSRYKIAKRLGASDSFLSKIANGQKHMPPTLAAELAEITGDDPREQALAALVDQEKDPQKRERLAQLFRLAPAASKAALVALVTALTGLSADPTSAAALRLDDDQSIAQGDARNGPFPPSSRVTGAYSSP